MSKEIFDRLIVHADNEGVTIRDSEASRFIRRLNDDDAELMAKADAKELMVTRQIRLVRIDWQENTYFIFFGFSEPNDIPTGLEETVLTPGTFAVSVTQSNIDPIASPSEIKDTIEELEAGGFELENIAALFPTMRIYLVTEKCEFHESEHRVLGSMLSKTYADGPILLKETTRSLLTNIIEGGSEFIPFHNLLQGILAISWDSIYLETYRCIEQMYSAPRVKTFRDGINSKYSLYDLASLLEEHLSWRPKEDDSLAKVLGFCDDNIISTASRAFNVDAESENIRSAIARQIYKLRNGIVHYRPDTDQVLKNDDEWNNIICSMLAIIEQLYEKQGEDFFEGPNEETSTSDS